MQMKRMLWNFFSVNQEFPQSVLSTSDPLGGRQVSRLGNDDIYNLVAELGFNLQSKNLKKNMQSHLSKAKMQDQMTAASSAAPLYLFEYTQLSAHF